MKRYAGSLVLVVVSFCFVSLAPPAEAQTGKIVIPAGTPEDHDLQAISNEQDAAKKLAMYRDFVQKYSSNPAAGMAHSTLGYAYIKQDKTAAAIPELKSAVGLLKTQDEQQYSIALYRLGFAYAKLNRVNEAREVLLEAVQISGPVQAMSKDLLTKVNAARAKGK